MNAYEIEKMKGLYLANELEKMRVKKQKASVNIRSNNTNNEQIKRFKNMYLLNNNINEVIRSAEAYYMLIGVNSIAVELVFNESHVVYSLKVDSDWKTIDLDILDIQLCGNRKPNMPHVVGKAEITAFIILANLGYSYGYARVMNTRKDYLTNIFNKIVEDKVLASRDHGIESIISELLMQEGIKKEFLQTFRFG